MKVKARTLLIGVLGALGAAWLGVPSAWLLGPLVSVALLALLGLPVAMPKATNPAVSLLLGVSVALTVDTDLLQRLGQWRSSVLMLGLMLALLLTLLFRYYRRQPGWRSSEALFCSVPGNLAIMLSMAADTSADLRRVALVHSIRLCFLVTLLPLVFPVAGPSLADMTLRVEHPEQLLSILLLGLLLGRLLTYCRVPAAMLFGGCIAALAVRAWLGPVHGLPDSLMLAVLAVLGSAVGARLDGVKPSQLVSELRLGVGGLIITLTVCGAFAWACWRFLDIPWIQAMLAYAPGGIEVMIAIAVSQDADAVFVASHQILRMVAMSLIVPVLLRRLQG